MKKTILIFIVALVSFGVNATAQTNGTVRDTAATFTIADSALFTGKYHYEGLPFEYMTIAVQDGKLSYAGGEYSGVLTPVKDQKDVFDADGIAIFTFVRNAEHQITQMKIEYQGQRYMGEREETEEEDN